MDKDTQEKISKLQALEQNLQNMLAQRQTFSGQLLEIESALKELDTKEPTYKLVGNIFVKKDPESLKQELSQKKELVELRIKTLEKQENQIKERSASLKEEVMKKINEKSQ